MLEIDYKIFIGFLTIVMIVYGYGVYILDILRGKTKPHMFSRIIYCITASIGFLIQFFDGAGPGAWGLGASLVTTGTITLLSFKYGEKHITTSDTISFSLGLIAIALYVLADNPLYSLILIICITIFGSYPTFRKSWNKPQEETVLAYVFAGARSFISIFALYNYSILTVAYPLFLVIVNASFVTLVSMRKKQLGQ